MKHFSIPKPCSEKWNEMTPTQKGAFCNKCAHEVRDVSHLSTNEIVQLIASEKKTPCMRMKPSQEHAINLELGNMFRSQKRNMQRAMLFSLLVVFGFTLFSCDNSQQIHERNLLESAARSMVETFEEAHIQYQKVLASAEIEGEESSEKQVVKSLDRIHLYDAKHEESLLMGQPAVRSEKVEQEVILPDLEIIRESYHTMGIPAVRYDIEPELVREFLIEKPMISKSDLPDKFDALAFPNPATSRTTLKVDLPSNTANLAIRLIDLNGQVLQSVHDDPADAGTHEFQIDLNDLTPAFYLIDVQFNDEHKVVRLSKV